MASKNTEKVNERLKLAEEAAAAGNFDAAIAYTNAAMAYTKTSAAATAVHDIRQSYYMGAGAARDAAQAGAPSGDSGSGGGGGGGGGGGSTVSTTSYASPAPTPAPVLPTFRPMTITNKNFKVAPTDIIQFDDESVEITLIQDLLFEDIGATELANISRSDLIDGQATIYSPIKNLPTIRREFNPNNIIATSFTLDYFSRFGIDIVSRGFNEPYFNDAGDLVIEIDSVQDDEEIQVEIIANGTIDIIEAL